MAANKVDDGGGADGANREGEGSGDSIWLVATVLGS